MIVNVYEKHCHEIEKITNKQVIPTIREAIEVITTTSKAWDNWSSRELQLSENLGIHLCVDTKYKDALANDIDYLYAHKKSLVLRPPHYDWKEKYNECAVVPEAKVEDADYRFGTITNIVGELRKFDETSFLSEIEKDAYNF